MAMRAIAMAHNRINCWVIARKGIVSLVRLVFSSITIEKTNFKGLEEKAEFQSSFSADRHWNWSAKFTGPTRE